MDAYERLVEGLPTRLSPGRTQRLTEKATRDAVAAIPLANPVQAAQEVEGLLERMLATTWNGGERLAALEHLAGPVANLCAGIERHIGAEPYPLPPASAERAATAQRLEWQLACAYAIGMHELCAPAGKVPMFKGKLIAAASVAALAHASEALQWSYRQYRAAPAGVWRLLHAVHAFAAECDVADQPADDPQVAGAVVSARAAYLQALLLAASNPYRFSTQELRNAVAAIRCVAGQCRLQAPTDAGVGIDAQADVGPHYVAGDAWQPGMLALDVEPATRIFAERSAAWPETTDALELPAPGGGVQPASRRFLDHLKAGWITAARGYGRIPANHVLDVAVGMRALHYALAGGVDFATFVRRVQGEAMTAGRHGLKSAAPWPVTTDAAEPPAFRGEVLDQSEGGYRLRLQCGVVEGTRLRIGDVIGLATAADTVADRDWMVGVIRWLTHTDDGELLGVELLHRTARAAGVRPITVAGEPLVAQRAIELPGAEGDVGLSLLIANRFPHHVTTVEIVLPALVSDWKTAAEASLWKFAGAEEVGAGCVQVNLLPAAEAVRA
ncbi:MAG TPA: hypothetical protein VF264_06685 [Rhodanobacteraceae bacterium]